MSRFACPACHAVMEAPPEKAGQKVTCLKCGQRLQIPSSPPGRPNGAKPPPPPRVDPAAASAGVVQATLAIRGHEGPVRSVMFSPDGNSVLSAGADGSARLWDLQGKELFRLQPPRGLGKFLFKPVAVVHAAFTPDGRRAFSAAADGTVRLWNLMNGREVRNFEVSDGVVAAALAADGRRLLVGLKRSVSIWDVEQGKLLVRVGGTSGQLKGDVQCVALTAQGRVLAGGLDGVTHLYDGESGKELRPLAGHTGGIYAVAVHPDGRHALTGGGDHRLFLWDLERGEGRAFAGHTGEVLGVAASRDGRLALSGGADQTARLWLLKEGKQAICFMGHADQVRCVAFSPTGNKAVSGGDDGVIRLWPVGT